MTTVAASTNTLVVSEVFGPTIQGEGPSAGRRASFIRLGGCNLHCSWCDTPYTWDARRYDLRQQMSRRSVDDLLETVNGHGTGLTVITGGEPLLQQEYGGWNRLLNGLMGDVEIETNGTRIPKGPVRTRAFFNVSPKLAHAGDPALDRINPTVLADFVTTGRAVFKFVVRDVDDLIEVDAIRERAGIPDRMIWIMPEASRSTAAVPSRHLADAVIKAGWNLTARMHLLIWGNERGR